MIDYALKNVRSRWARSLLTVLGLSVMITLIITITGIVDSQRRAMHEHAAAGAGKISIQPILAGTTYPAEGVDLAEDTAEAILSLVAERVQPALSGKALYFVIAPPPYPSQPPEAIVVGLESGHEEGFTGSVANDVCSIAGVEFLGQIEAPCPAILGNHAADYFAIEGAGDLRPGDTIRILDRVCTVAGILDRSADLVVNNAVIVPLPVAQDMLGKEGFVSSIILTPGTVGAEAEIIAAIQESYPRMNVVDDSTTRDNLEEGIKLFEDMINAISAVVVVAATILIATVMVITVKERTKEIGILRALGCPSGTVVMSILWETLILSAAGSILGGFASGFVLRYAMMENLFDLAHIVRHLPLAIVIALAASFVPVLQITRIVPIESLRYE
jgi:putative ABC transport system permease protein